ncbi:MAG: hypothetical protein GX157_01465 [Candidatus Cloacimonetes bacterium]|nr:hypothetical protein [Candidatus Cloacimonadota bacterium]
MKDVIIIAIFVSIVLGTGFYVYGTLHAPIASSADSTDPILIDSDPIQTSVPDTLITEICKGKERYTLHPKARYRLNGRIVCYKRYYKGYFHLLSPWDYASLWGDIDRYLPYLKFDQIFRFCLFKTKHPEKVDIAYIERHMANNHLIPATQNIRRAMGKVKKSDLVRIEGFLVNVTGVDAKNRVINWKTSTTREDTGNGACEIIYVSKLRLNNNIYE